MAKITLQNAIEWAEEFQEREMTDADELALWKIFDKLPIPDRILFARSLEQNLPDEFLDLQEEIRNRCKIPTAYEAPSGIPHIDVRGNRKGAYDLVRRDLIYTQGWGLFDTPHDALKVNQETPISIEAYQIVPGRTAVFADYASGNRALFELEKDQKPELVLQNKDQDRSERREFFVHKKALGLVGLVSPQQDYSFIAKRENPEQHSALDMDMDSVETYRELAQFASEVGRQIGWHDFYKFRQSEQSLPAPERMTLFKSLSKEKEKPYNPVAQEGQLSDRAYILEITGINSASKIFNQNFQEKRLPRTPVNHEARVVAPRKNYANVG